MNYIIGENRDQRKLMPDSIEDYVGEENPVRVIDAYVNRLDLTAMGFITEQANGIGRPMYSPWDMLKLYLYGYLNRIRSSRRLETETMRNLELFWLMNMLSPDHKTIAEFRRKNARALKNVFRDFVRLCIDLGLYGKELLAIDGSKFKADNSKDNNFNLKKLADRIARLDKKIEDYIQALEKQDKEESRSDKSPEKMKELLKKLEERKTTYESYKAELKASGETQKSLTDPDSRLMKGNGKMDVSYNVQMVVDSKNKMVVEFSVGNNGNDHNQMSVMSEKSIEMLETNDFLITADKGYNGSTDIVKTLELGIIPHVAGCDIEVCIPVSEEEQQEVTSHTVGQTIYIRRHNVAICPMGKLLYPSYMKSNGTAVFTNSKACSECNFKCTKENYKKFEITMKPDEFSKEYDDSNLWVKQIRITANKEIVSRRKDIAEHPFGILKRAMETTYVLLRGMEKVSGEFALTFLAFNMKRAINILGVGELLTLLRV